MADLRHRISAEWRSASPQNEACGQLANAEVHLSTQVPWSQHCQRDLRTHTHSEYIYTDTHIFILSLYHYLLCVTHWVWVACAGQLFVHCLPVTPGVWSRSGKTNQCHGCPRCSAGDPDDHRFHTHQTVQEAAQPEWREEKKGREVAQFICLQLQYSTWISFTILTIYNICPE